MTLKSTERFSDRVENYILYRPNYPDDLISFFIKENILIENAIIADIGSGTGILTELFLKNKNKVFAIEPNAEMRDAAERLLHHYPNFNSINATAENTSLQNESVNLIVAGQAFHWFDFEKTKKEFARILKSDGIVALIWNDRKTEESDFSKDYEKLIHQYASDYEKVNHKNIDEEKLYPFFSGEMKIELFPNYQSLNFEGLQGRLLSSSYIPTWGENFDSMINELKTLFQNHHQNGKVTIEYETKVFYGKVKD
jgi:ubiquinone/menaquinone biosynthesis C-methylase UbiE